MVERTEVRIRSEKINTAWESAREDAGATTKGRVTFGIIAP